VNGESNANSNLLISHREDVVFINSDWGGLLRSKETVSQKMGNGGESGSEAKIDAMVLYHLYVGSAGLCL
jgi:hypothetical protein